MDLKLKSIKKYPRSAWALYFKLYCERNGGIGKNKRKEAYKSWLSLSESEREQFCTKYKEGRSEKFVNYLKKAEPFLKEKDTVKRSHTITTNEAQDTNNRHDTEINNSVCLEIESPTIEIQGSENNDVSAFVRNAEELNNFEDPETLPIDTQEIQKRPTCEQLPLSLQTLLQDTQEVQKSPTHTQYEKTKNPPREPLPPTLKSGKELFDMVKLVNGETRDSWKSLRRIDKYQYSRAVLRLKKEYINKYREYLESLSQRELFDHYNKIF